MIMRIIQLTLIGLIAVAGSMAAQAQQSAANTQPGAASSAMAKDCTKAAKRHDHAAEKGMGSSVPNPCAQAQAASGPPSKKMHDHQQVHK
jgi:hypothetical protein